MPTTVGRTKSSSSTRQVLNKRASMPLDGFNNMGLGLGSSAAASRSTVGLVVPPPSNSPAAAAAAAAGGNRHMVVRRPRTSSATSVLSHNESTTPGNVNVSQSSDLLLSACESQTTSFYSANSNSNSNSSSSYTLSKTKIDHEDDQLIAAVEVTEGVVLTTGAGGGIGGSQTFISNSSKRFSMPVPVAGAAAAQDMAAPFIGNGTGTDSESASTTHVNIVNASMDDVNTGISTTGRRQKRLSAVGDVVDVDDNTRLSLFLRNQLSYLNTTFSLLDNTKAGSPECLTISSGGGRPSLQADNNNYDNDDDDEEDDGQVSPAPTVDTFESAGYSVTSSRSSARSSAPSSIVGSLVTKGACATGATGASAIGSAGAGTASAGATTADLTGVGLGVLTKKVTTRPTTTVRMVCARDCGVIWIGLEDRDFGLSYEVGGDEDGMDDYGFDQQAVRYNQLRPRMAKMF